MSILPEIKVIDEVVKHNYTRQLKISLDTLRYLM